MKYKVNINLTIYNFDRTCFSSGNKKIELPFVPFIGLRFTHLWGSCPGIDDIKWCEETDSFSCSINAIEVDCGDGDILDLEYLSECARNLGYSHFEKIFTL